MAAMPITRTAMIASMNWREKFRRLNACFRVVGIGNPRYVIANDRWMANDNTRWLRRNETKV